jgi:hypothetical protein
VGYLDVQRVAGAISFLPTPSAEGQTLAAASLNMSHVIHDWWFGPRITPYQLSRLPKGTQEELHRLAGRKFVSTAADTSHHHAAGVVGSTFTFATGHFVETYRYTAHSHAVRTAAGSAEAGDGSGAQDSLPHVRVAYTISDVAIHTAEVRGPLYRFLTSLCAIAGGVYTVVSLLDSLTHALLGSAVFKANIGKAS